jgi:uncharacterized DUF497 family protein
MEFEWDEDKRAANVARHGIDFLDAGLLFDGRPVATRASPRGGEARWMSTGLLDGRYVTVVWTWRGRRIRLISARRARHGEEEAHRHLHG